MTAAAFAMGASVAGCGSFLPPGPLPVDLADHVEGAPDGTAIVWTVRPWPLDEPAAYLCADDPSETFAAPDPRLPSGASCAELEATVDSDTLSVRADRSALAPEIGVALGIGQPLFLAIAGRRGGVSAAHVVEVVDPLVLVDPGPTQ